MGYGRVENNEEGVDESGRWMEDFDAVERPSFPELLLDAEGGDELAMTDVALIYATGSDGVEKNPAEAAKWMRKAAELGDETAQYFTGRFLLAGFGVECNRTQAIQWLRKSARQGYAKALELLSKLGE